MSKIVYVVTGPKGVGKSTALATYPPVEETCETVVLDTEDSMSDIVESFAARGKPFGDYIRAYDRYQAGDDMLTRMAKGDLPWVNRNQRNSLVGYYEWLVREMAVRLTPGKYKHLILDTIEPLEAAITAAVQEGKGKFGWTGVTAYGRMETEGVRPLYEGLLEGFHRAGIETILIASHIKPAWLNKRPVPGKVKAGGRMAVLARLSTAMFWLVHNPLNEDGAPAALVLKARIGHMDIVDGRWVARRVLPERMPHFSWQDVDAYRKSPANYTNPKRGEVMALHEREMISEVLNDAQMKYMVMGAEADRTRSAPVGVTPVAKPVDVGDVIKNKDKRAKEMLAAGKPAPVIAKELGLPLPVVLSYIKGGE